MMFSVKSLRFGSEGENLLFQTQRLNIYGKGNLEAQSGGFGQLADIGKGIYGVFQDAFSPNTAEEAKPSRDAGNLRIELGGRNNFDVKKTRETLKGWISYGTTLVKEIIAVFIKKLGSIIGNAQGFEGKITAAVNIAKGFAGGGEAPKAPTA